MPPAKLRFECTRNGRRKREIEVTVDRMLFEDFYGEARHRWLRAVAAHIGTVSAAEELVAEAFTRAWRNWDRVGAHSSPSAGIIRYGFPLLDPGPAEAAGEDKVASGLLVIGQLQSSSWVARVACPRRRMKWPR
jgi:hypothetical protein